MEQQNAENVVEPADDESLWMIVAMIQPFKLDAVTLALEAIPNFGGMTVSECRGFGKEKVIRDASHTHEANAGLVDFTAKVRIECAVSGSISADAVMKAIATAAHTGNRGDGKLFAWPMNRAVRIRTFEKGANAL